MISSALCPVVFSNTAAIAFIGAAKFAATATCTSSACASAGRPNGSVAANRGLARGLLGVCLAGGGQKRRGGGRKGQIGWTRFSLFYKRNGEIKEAEAAGTKAKILSWGGKIAKE